MWPIIGPAADTELAESPRATSIDLTATEMAALNRARESATGPEPPR